MLPLVLRKSILGLTAKDVNEKGCLLNSKFRGCTYPAKTFHVKLGTWFSGGRQVHREEGMRSQVKPV